MPTAPPIHRPFAGLPGKRTRVRKDDAGARFTRKVHNSSAWRYKVQPAHLRQFPLCAICLEAEGRVVAAEHVDHIVALRDGGAPYDASNLRSLCRSHHSSATRRWQNDRGTDPAPAPPGPTYTVA